METAKGKRKRKCTLSPTEKKRRLKERRDAFNKSRIVIGNQFDRWRSFQKERGLKSDTETAQYLLDRKNSPGDTSFGGPLEKLQSVRGLPVNVPFKIRFSSSISHHKLVSATHIIVEYSSLGLTPTETRVEIIDLEDTVVENVMDRNRIQDHQLPCTPNLVERDREDTTKENIIYRNYRQNQQITCSRDMEDEATTEIKGEDMLPYIQTDFIQIKSEPVKPTVDNDETELIHEKYDLAEEMVTSIIDEIIDTAVDKCNGITVNTSCNNISSRKSTSKLQSGKYTPKIVLIENNTGEGRRSSRIQSKGYRLDYSALDEDFTDIEDEMIANDTSATTSCDEDEFLKMRTGSKKDTLSNEPYALSFEKRRLDKTGNFRNENKLCLEAESEFRDTCVKIEEIEGDNKTSSQNQNNDQEIVTDYKKATDSCNENVVLKKGDREKGRISNESYSLDSCCNNDLIENEIKYLPETDKRGDKSISAIENDRITRRIVQDKDPDFDPSVFSDKDNALENDNENDSSDLDWNQDIEQSKDKKQNKKRKHKISITKKEKHSKKKKCSDQPDYRINKKRITVTLLEHKDKYYEEEIESTEMKDRGKNKVEKTQKYLVCAICKKFKTIQQRSLESHIEIHLNGDFDCKQCEAKFQSRYELMKHKNMTHEEVDPYQCVLCLEKNGCFVALQSHLKLVHGTKRFLCKFCHRGGTVVTFEKQTELNLHYQEVHQDELVQCMKCNTYHLKNRIATHLRYNCGQFSDATCEYCGKIVKSITLALHINRVHASRRHYKCNKCDYAAKSRSALNHHIRSKHTSKSDLGVLLRRCEHCDFTCVQSIQMQSHMRTHTGEKPYKCDQCAYAAAWNVQLKEHKKLHGLPFCVTCDQCGVLMKEKMLNIHKKKKHSENF